MAINYKALSGITNQQFWDQARAANTQFASITSAGTQETFTEKGFEAISQIPNALSTFFELSIRIAFQKLDIARAKDPLEDIGLVEYYDTPNGGFTQRIAVAGVDPISPGYTANLEEGDYLSPFVERRPESEERFFQQNFNYQNLISIKDYEVKQIFLNENGMAAYIAGVLEGMETGRIKQEYANKKEVLSAGLNSTEHPLKESQIIATSIPQDIDSVSEAQLLSFTESVMDLMEGMEAQASSDQYNAASFDTYVDRAEYVMLLRTPIYNRIKTRLRVGAYNPEDLAIPVDRMKAVNDFGGIVPYTDDTYATRLYPIFSYLGAQSGYYITSDNATSAGLTTITGSDNATIGYSVARGVKASGVANAVAKADVVWKDENAEIMAVVAQRGLIFENRQNPYTVTPIYNPRRLVTSYWANSPANTIAYDYYYNVIVFTGAAE